jgi:hypothetical protein
MEDLVDAFLYLGPQDLRLKEKIPADIALDDTYRTELQRGGAMFGFPDAASETPNDFDRQIVKTAEDPIFAIPEQPRDPKGVEQAVHGCLERKDNRYTSIDQARYSHFLPRRKVTAPLIGTQSRLKRGAWGNMGPIKSRERRVAHSSTVLV